MVPILVAMTLIGCVGVQALTRREKRTPLVGEREIRRAPWALTEEVSLKY